MKRKITVTPKLTRADAIATIKSMIYVAIANTASQTGLRAGPVSELLIDEIVVQITHPSIQWVWKEI